MGCLVLENMVLSAMYFNGTKITENNSEHTFVISRDMFCVQCISMEKIVLFCFVAVLCVSRNRTEQSRENFIFLLFHPQRHLNLNL